MSSITVEVIEDAAHPEGGHAIIRLRGLKAKPDSDAFVIEHAGDARGQSAPKGWPAGVRTPLKTRLSEAGFDIMVGPDVVENPVLLPGTPVVIKVPAAGVTSQVLWPDIKPLRRQKVKRIITSTDRRNAIARAQTSPAADGMTGITKVPATDFSSNPVPGVVRDGAPVADAEAGSRHGSATGADSTRNKAGLSTLSARVPPKTSAAAAGPGAPVAGSQSAGMPPGLPVEPTSFAPDSEAGSAAPATSREPDWSGGMKGKTGSDKGVVGSTIIHTQPGKSRSIGLAGGIALFGLLTALVAGGLFYKFKVLDGSATATVSDGNSQTAQPLFTLYDAFRAGAVSPRGIEARETTTARSIERASANLYGTDGKRDSVEAAFWLKKYLAKQMDDRQLLWALTQLGSTYAQPVDGAPDYFKARMLWETAAALGDPVAACFLGGLHEFGLGVPADKPAARKWYLQAKSTGGCRFLDKAIARVADQ